MPAPRKRPAQDADITIDDSDNEEILNAVNATLNNLPKFSTKRSLPLSTASVITPRAKKLRTTTPDHSPPKLTLDARTASSLLPLRTTPRATRSAPPAISDQSISNGHSLFLDTSAVTATPRPKPPPLAAKAHRPRPPVTTSSQYDLSKVDWTLCDPLAQTCNLFKYDYLLYGNPSYRQADSKTRFYPARGRKDLAALAKSKPREPSWARSADLRSLANKLNTHEEFFATCWISDVLGDDMEDVDTIGPWGERPVEKVVEESKKGIRKMEVSGIDMMLIGKEFPCRNVLLVGIVVEVEVVEEKNIIAYRIDDSTGIIRCVCPIPKPGLKIERQVSRPGSLPGTPVKVIPARTNYSKLEKMRRGTLVKVVGKVVDGAFPGADFVINVEKLEALKDSNAETRHHLLVDRLHREVYSQDFDLTTLLDRMRREEREEERDWKGSQVTASVAGSPTKQQKIKLRAPAQLDDASLTISTFTWYIHHHLLHHKILTTSVSSRPSTPSPRKSANEISLDLSFDTYQPDDSTPIPFTVTDLESARSLYTFAEILAQKNHREKKLGKGRQVTKNQSWSKVQKGGGSVAHFGARGGNAILLPPPAAPKRKGKSKDSQDVTMAVVEDERVKLGGKEVVPLTGAELEKAVARVFVEAMRTMRKAGTIILTSTLDSTLERIDLDDIISSTTRTVGSTSTSTSSLGMGTKGSGYWSLDLEPESAPSIAQDTTQWVVHELPDQPPKKSTVGWELDLGPVEPPIKQVVVQPVQKKSSAYWELDLGDSNAVPVIEKTPIKRPGYWPLDLETTPRASTTASTTSTSTQLFLPPSLRKSVPFLLPSSPNTTALSDLSTTSNDPWTKSMQEIDTESFELVTISSLAPYLLRILKNESERSYSAPLATKSTNHPSVVVTTKVGHKGGKTGCSEEIIRKRLANDSRWEAVSKTDLVSSALEELCRRNFIRSAGGLWKFGSR